LSFSSFPGTDFRGADRVCVRAFSTDWRSSSSLKTAIGFRVVFDGKKRPL
jgi:hypothetical protein